MHELYTKRVYLPFASTDGYRILVDRIWPRGIKKVLCAFRFLGKKDRAFQRIEKVVSSRSTKI